MLLVVMTLGSLTIGVAAEELLDLPVMGLYLKMGGGVLRPICATARVYRTFGGSCFMHCSCIVKVLIAENFNELPLTFNASSLYNNK